MRRLVPTTVAVLALVVVLALVIVPAGLVVAAPPAPAGAAPAAAAAGSPMPAATAAPTGRQITPDPAGPRDEPVVYRNGCHAGRVVTKPHVCRYGERGTGRTVLVFGDSHVAQWYGALRRAARAEGERLLWLTKSACPAVDVPVRVWRSHSRYTQCDTWRPRAFRRIAAIAPDVVVTASYSFHQVLNAKGHKLSGARRAAAWQRGEERMLARLAPVAGTVVQLRDTARQRVDVPRCLVAHDLRRRPCRTPTSWALPKKLWRIERTAGRAYANVRSVDLSSAMCGVRWCGPVDGHVLRWRDDSHLTDTYSRRLAPLLRPYLR